MARTGIEASVWGHCGGPAKTRQAGSSTVTEVSVAVNSGRKGEVSNTWVKISAWGRTGEWLAQDALKGALVLAHGDLTIREYQRKDGTKGTSVELRASSCHVLAGGQGAGQQGQERPPVQRQAAPATRPAAAPYDDDLPF